MGSIPCRGCLHDLIGINTSMGYIHVCNGINSVYGIATHKNKKHNSVAYTESNYKFGDEFCIQKG